MLVILTINYMVTNMCVRVSSLLSLTGLAGGEGGLEGVEVEEAIRGQS